MGHPVLKVFGAKNVDWRHPTDIVDDDNHQMKGVCDNINYWNF